MDNIFQKGAILKMVQLVDYSGGGIISKQIIKSESGNITLFSFDKGQFISEHSAPFDAFVQVLEGQVEMKIGGKPFNLTQGDSIILPANISHAILAIDKFKMLLTMIKGETI